MIHSNQGNASWHFVLIFFIALILCYVTAVDGKCSANDNRYWDRKLKDCAVCTQCTHGQARNFSEKFNGSTGSKGDKGCLPCRRPPPGYYIRVLGTHAFFQLCGKKCADLFRHQQIPCGDFSDAVCGSCYAGYHEETNNADFACIKHTPSTTTTIKSTLPALVTTTLVNETEQLDNDRMFSPDNRAVTLVAKDGDSLSATKLTVGISCGVVAVVACLAAAISFYRWKKLQQKTLEVRRLTERFDLEVGHQNSVAFHVNGSPSVLTTDGLPGTTNIERCSLFVQSTTANEHQNESEEATEEYSMSVPLVRHNNLNISLGGDQNYLTMDGPRRPVTTDCCRQELPSMQTAVVTDNHNALPLDVNRPLSRSMDWTICKCRERKQCTCKDLSEQSQNIKMLNKMDSIDIVARHICHDPKKFFQSLKVVNSKFYQTFVDMDRREERAESYRNVLRGWVHIRGDKAVLSDLLDALCKHNFHDICDQIARDMHGETHLKQRV